MSVNPEVVMKSENFFEWSFARLGNEYTLRSPEFLFANSRWCFEWLEPGLSQMSNDLPPFGSDVYESVEHQFYLDWLERPRLSIKNLGSSNNPVNIDFSVIHGIVEATSKKINRQKKSGYSTEIIRKYFNLQPERQEVAFTYSTNLYTITSFKITFHFLEKVIVCSEVSSKIESNPSQADPEEGKKGTNKPESERKGKNSELGYQCIENLIKDFKGLLSDNSLCDIELKCEDERSVKAHKVILCARSKVFAAMFQSDMEDSQSGVVKIPDMDVERLKTFLHYIYTGILPDLTMDTAKQLYRAGDKYGLLELKKICAEFSANNMSVDNVCDLLVMADLHSDSDLKEKAVAYILENKVPCSSDHWEVLAKSHPNLAVQVLTKFYKMKCP